ncbi:MAG TPA: hypothetical protein PK970_11285 [Hyphomicrobiaceae bacterium]|nr:hypothetical protein [Hyphomicrobiaceae bacterium]
MSAYRIGREPKSILPSAARAFVFGAVAVAVTGCAANKQPSYVRGPDYQQMAAAQTRPVEMEDDGIPVQTPPVRAMKPEEDDPTQPWSPNYGKGRSADPALPSRPAPRQVEAALRPSLMPASSGALRAMSEDEADAIMQSAIAIHEMRNQ